MYLRDRELQMRFSQFEAFYPRHVQCRITLAVRELARYFFAPFERLIHSRLLIF